MSTEIHNQPIINYIVASYSGFNLGRQTRYFDEYVLDIQLTKLYEYLKFRESNHFIHYITVVVPEPKNSSHVYKNYYKPQKWEYLFTSLGVHFHMLKYIGENKHYSYDQFLQGMYYRLYDADYHILIEDDYLVNDANFDKLILESYRSKFSDNIGYLCTAVMQLNMPTNHASIATGMISSDTIRFLESKLQISIQDCLYSFSKLFHVQYAFSLLFQLFDVPIADWRDTLSAWFWCNGTKRLIDYSIRSPENLYLIDALVPIEYFLENNKINIEDYEEISLFKVFMSKELDSVTEVLKSGYITQGSKVEEFENQLKDYFNYPYILTLNSATSGLTLALRLLNLEAGDYVLATPLTCMATNEPILANGSKIKWVDVNPKTCNMDIEDLKSKIDDSTKAVVFVHWGGGCMNLDDIEDIKLYAKENYDIDLRVIEDCAHAFGSKYDEKYLGTHGNNIAVYSTQAIKQLTTVDGGLIFLPNEELYNRAKLLRWFGINREQRSGGGDFRMEPDVVEWGYKFHMNDVNATIGLANLPHVAMNNTIVKSNVNYYRKSLANLPKITLLDNPPKSEPANWLFTILVENREDFMKMMKARDIMVSAVHKRNDINTCFAEFRVDLPSLDYVSERMVCIPCGWWVTEVNRDKIFTVIRDWSQGL